MPVPMSYGFLPELGYYVPIDDLHPPPECSEDRPARGDRPSASPREPRPWRTAFARAALLLRKIRRRSGRNDGDHGPPA